LWGVECGLWSGWVSAAVSEFWLVSRLDKT
jgi:hypothetical protein